MTTSSSGSVKWSQVSEDLVPVNISCVQPTLEGLAAAAAHRQQQQQQSSNGTASAPAGGAGAGGAGGAGSAGGASSSTGGVSAAEQVVFHITAYNSQVEKILDVKLVQPGKKERKHTYAGRRQQKILLHG